MSYYNLFITGSQVTEHELEEVAIQSGVLAVADDFLSPEFRAECTRVVISENIKPKDCKNAFIYLKQNFDISNV